jgi:molybdopterin molybdotransferase
MISKSKALSIIKNNTNQIDNEKVEVEKAIDRVLTIDVKSTITSPPFDMSAMDGYAIKYNKISNLLKPFQVLSEVFAGDSNDVKISNQEAIRIFTGGKVPAGANMIIIQENVKILKNNKILINQAFFGNTYIRKKGQDYKKGKVLLKKGKKINVRDIGLLLSSGINKVTVYRQPNVAVIATGNELLNPKRKLKDNKIYASSLYMLKNLLQLSGAKCIGIKIIKDDEKLIKKYVKSLKNPDIIITTGGVSVGKKDLVKSTLNKLGMIQKFWKVSIKPGKPVLYGKIKNIHIFGLPGNPVSTYVCYFLFVLETISRMKGQKNTYIKIKKAILLNDINNNSSRESYYRGKYLISNNQISVHTLNSQDSSLLHNLSTANCLIKVPSNLKIIKKGKIIEIILLEMGF